jgi:flagellar protein FliO/FliZ
MGWVLLKTLASLATVLGLMFGLVVVMKKYMFGFQAARSAVISVDVLGQRLLQPKRSVVVVKVLNKIMIVGMTEAGMTLLGEINDADILHWIDTTIAEADSLTGFPSAKKGNNGAFVEYLGRNIGMLRPKNRKGSAGTQRPETEEEY